MQYEGTQMVEKKVGTKKLPLEIDCGKGQGLKSFIRAEELEKNSLLDSECNRIVGED